MATVVEHLALAEQLLRDMRSADQADQWPVVVDAGYYAVFHAIEATNALECRDSFSFADFADILENVLTPRVLDPSLRDAYQYLFYFRRGTIYGCHTPTAEQLAEYARTVEQGITHVRGAITRSAT